jgi:hypothetical protein
MCVSDRDLAEFCVQAELVAPELFPHIAAEVMKSAEAAKTATATAEGASGLKYPVLGLALSTIVLGSESKIVSNGLPATAPAVYFDKEYTDCFSIGPSLLWDLIGNKVTSITYEHDPDGVTYPEVKLALMEAGGDPENNCFVVATCDSSKIWAVGIASGWKNREKAAKIALALALADEEEIFEKAIEKYSYFAQFCVTAGLIPESKLWKIKKKQKGAWNSAGWSGQKSPTWQQSGGQGWESDGAWQAMNMMMGMFSAASGQSTRW